MRAQMIQDKHTWIVSAEDGTCITFTLQDEDRARDLYESKLSETRKKP